MSDDPLGDDGQAGSSEVVDELCHLLKLTREEYYSLKEFESKPCKLSMRFCLLGLFGVLRTRALIKRSIDFKV